MSCAIRAVDGSSRTLPFGAGPGFRTIDRCTARSHPGHRSAHRSRGTSVADLELGSRPFS